MPETKHYEGKKKGHGHHHGHQEKRRPHHEAQHAADEAKAETHHDEPEKVAADEINTEAQNEGMQAARPVYAPDAGPEDMISEGSPVEETPEKTHLNFYGSEVIRQKAPKVMEFADTVADEWKKDGKFEDLPVSHPMAQMAAGKALRKAKDVEKKLEEKGVFAMAKMGMEYVKSEIEKRKKH